MLQELIYIAQELLTETRASRDELRQVAEALAALRIEILSHQLGEDRDVTLEEIAALWGVSTKTVSRLSKDAAEPFQLVKVAGRARASLGQIRRYHRIKFSNAETRAEGARTHARSTPGSRAERPKTRRTSRRGGKA